jgi:acyl-CoA-binding protein
VVNVKKLMQRPGDEELLKLYSLFKQAVFGDNTAGILLVQ